MNVKHLYLYSYKLRIESMLLKEEFAANISYLDPCINAMIYAGGGMYIRLHLFFRFCGASP